MGRLVLSRTAARLDAARVEGTVVLSQEEEKTAQGIAVKAQGQRLPKPYDPLPRCPIFSKRVRRRQSPR